MRLLRGLALIAAVPALVVAASCAPFPIVADFTAGSSGNGGGAFDGNGGAFGTSTSTGTNISAGAGGDFAGSSTSTGTGTPSTFPTNPYEYLCGGSAAACIPGSTSDTCAQGGNPGMGGSAADAGALSCQIVAGDGGITAQCGVSGDGLDSAICMRAADCAPDLGCVDELAPICRAYCCAGLESCPAGTYCVTETMHEAPQTKLPVCIPARNCILLGDATCPDGQTCAIVRASGTTSCVPVGAGTYGQSCDQSSPSAAGFTCSLTDGMCQKVCQSTKDCLSNWICEGGTSPYPQGFGYCVEL